MSVTPFATAALVAAAAFGFGCAAHAGTLRPVTAADVAEIAAGRAPSPGVVVLDCSDRDGDDTLPGPGDPIVLPRVCVVPVQVEVDRNRCRVVEVPDVIVAPPQTRRIVWRLQGPGARQLSFRATGILVRDNTSPTGEPRFERVADPDAGTMPERFVMRRRTLEPGNRVDYDIQLRRTDGTVCEVFDPVIVNRG